MDFVAKIEDSQRERIGEIAGSLEKMGVRVRQVQPILGLITGASETLSLEQLKIEGIAMVEPDRKWGAGMPGKGEAASRAEKGEGEAAGKPVKDEREAEERRAVAKRSSGKGKRKD
ncbi:MAG TPA: hypothetical protein VG101_09160 [Puia sp.]|jgi:hypothetical protein|nr:hypothetical protein [Puia sp.]